MRTITGISVFIFVCILYRLPDVLSGPVKGGVTEKVTWKKDDIVFPNETLAALSVNEEGDIQAINGSSSCERKVQRYLISVIVASLLAGIELIILVVTVILYNSRKSPVPDAGLPNEDEPYKGRISFYELWKLAQYAVEQRESDTLKDVIRSLTNGRYPGSRRSGHGSTKQDLYKELCRWKKQNSSMNQMELLFDKCIDAKMIKAIRQLRDLRRCVSDVPSSFSDNIRGILWQIGRKSKKNITDLLEKLNVENVNCDHSLGLKGIVDEAFRKLDRWKEGLVPINPVVMLSFALEDLNLLKGLDSFFRGSDERRFHRRGNDDPNIPILHESEYYFPL